MKSDVWSFGVLMWEIINKSDPYKELFSSQVAVQVANGKLKPSQNGVFPDLDAIMDKCTQFAAADRPTFKEICGMLNSENQ